MRKFEEFLDHKNDTIAQMASLLAEAQAGLEAGDMTHNEFVEISHNILEFVDIDSLAEDVETKVIIKETIEILQFIVEHVPLI